MHRAELQLTSLRAGKQSRSGGVIVQREHKYKYTMNATEQR